MKVCLYCAVETRFVLLDEVDGKKVWSPPMEAVSRTIKKGRVKSFEYPPLTVTEVFHPHECAGVLAEREAKRLNEQYAYARRQDTARRKAGAWDEALKIVCPKCGAFAGSLCYNLSKAGASTKWPHEERLPEGWADRV